MNSISRGALIILEGCDRSGKTTQTKKLVELLKIEGIKAKYMSFPARDVCTGAVIDSYLKNSLSLSDECIHLLFSANRWELRTQLENDLLAGVTVVVDRYSFSGIAYSMAKGMDYEWCKNPEKGLIKPDLLLYLTAPIDVLSKRSNFGSEIYEKVEFQNKVAGAIKKLCEEEKSYCQEINANSSQEEISQILLEKAINIVKAIKGQPLKKLWA